ncbi:MAG TPA: tetratricopeptide repeat protein [Gemmatimonadales bacterium]|nr:tetratricopeptide repeat protein [Gemmatimonadales bacterium]
MPSRPRVFALAACIIAAAPPPPPLVAQGQGWEPPQPPCDVKAGHFRVTSAIVNLKTAAEKPITRDRMLQQTNDVLTRAITNDGQGQNPGAWYYLGRYYVEMGDGAGADSAFRRAVALAPQCQQDIDRYRERLWVDVINAGMRNWQESRPDSAKLLLRQAAALRPGHPRAFLTLGQIYASENKLDSSAVFLGRAAAAAGNDTAFAEQKKDALGTVARLSARRLQADSAAQRWQRTRFSRDSIQRLLATDSVILTRIEASSASRRGRGARLAPADQQAFSRDSSGRARAAADRRAALAARASAVAADSAAAQAAFDPAIRAFQSYLEAYPEATDAVPGLASLYYQSGRAGDAVAAFEKIYPSSRRLAPEVAFEAGRSALRANVFAVGTKLLARGIEQLPYDRDALVDLANGYLALRDSAHLLPVAQRLANIDPMNRTTLRLLAAGWDLRGRRDSAQKYKDLADGALQVEIAINGLQRDSAGYTLTGAASNAGTTPSIVQRLTFEFLDAMGNVQVSQTIELPPLPPQGSRPIEIRVPGTALVAWRYRPS